MCHLSELKLGENEQFWVSAIHSGNSECKLGCWGVLRACLPLTAQKLLMIPVIFLFDSPPRKRKILLSVKWQVKMFHFKRKDWSGEDLRIFGAKCVLLNNWADTRLAVGAAHLKTLPVNNSAFWSYIKISMKYWNHSGTVLNPSHFMITNAGVGGRRFTPTDS